MKLMKEKMAEKIKKPASDELKKFDQLPVAKPKEEPKDAITDFLDKARTQEAKEREDEAKKNKDPTASSLIQAAHKDITQDESIESNPLTEMYVKKHPEVLSQATETDWGSLARGEDQ